MYSYPWAVLYGVYLYIIFHLVFFLTFGHLNTQIGILDVYIWIVGSTSVLGLMYFMKQLPRSVAFMFVPFILAVPFGYVGALGGGLLGPVGTLVFGLVPFAILLPLGYWVIKRLLVKPSAPVAPREETSA